MYSSSRTPERPVRGVKRGQRGKTLTIKTIERAGAIDKESHGPKCRDVHYDDRFSTRGYI